MGSVKNISSTKWYHGQIKFGNTVLRAFCSLEDCFWVQTPWSLIGGYRRFRRRYPSIGLHGVATQKTTIWTITVVKSSERIISSHFISHFTVGFYSLLSVFILWHILKTWQSLTSGVFWMRTVSSWMTESLSEVLRRWSVHCTTEFCVRYCSVPETHCICPYCQL
jgi:hypothetical protein